jgi:hypothetical protein
LTENFEFTDGGRTFSCTVERPRHAGTAAWWWFRLDGEPTTRYAPFEASARDTQQSVEQRVIAYYAELLAIKARPVHQRPRWNGSGGFRSPKPEAEAQTLKTTP